MTRGLVWGKFLPLHAGHQHLIKQARKQCDELVILIGGRLEEPWSIQTRAGWLEELYPWADVRSHWSDLPIDYDDPAVWDLHIDEVRTYVPEPIDVVFTSEDYGDELARRLDCKHVCVDRDRTTYPISGTAARTDLEAAWPFLPPPVRSSLCRRIVIVGAESTGTTTLAAALAEELETWWVPEYGREWSMVRPSGPWESHEFELIAGTQNRLEDRTARNAPVPWIVCDTDALATTVWHERYVGGGLLSIEILAAARRPYLYVLTLDDIPFVQDGLRDGEHLRPWMTQRFREVLQGKRTIEVQGSVDERLALVRRELELLQAQEQFAGW